MPLAAAPALSPAALVSRAGQASEKPILRPLLAPVSPEILEEAAQSMLDRDPNLLPELAKEAHVALPEGVATRAQLKAWTEQHKPASLLQRLTDTANGAYHTFRDRNFGYWRWPILTAVGGTIISAIASTPEAITILTDAAGGGIAGFGAGLGSSAGAALGDHLNYLIFWSRKYPSLEEYVRNARKHEESPAENLETFSSGIARIAGLIGGGAASLFALNTATELLTRINNPLEAIPAETLLPALALIMGGAALRYAGTAADAVKRFITSGRESKHTKDLHALAAKAEHASGESYFADNLAASLAFLEGFLDDKVKKSIKDVSTDIDGLTQKINETNAYYAGLKWDRMSPEQRSRAEAQKAQELAAYQSQRDQLANQVLAQLNEGRELGEFLARQMKLELGQNVPMTTITDDREYGLLVERQLELRALNLKNASEAFDLKAAQATALVTQLKRVILHADTATRTYRELKGLDTIGNG